MNVKELCALVEESPPAYSVYSQCLPIASSNWKIDYQETIEILKRADEQDDYHASICDHGWKPSPYYKDVEIMIIKAMVSALNHIDGYWKPDREYTMRFERPGSPF